MLILFQSVCSRRLWDGCQRYTSPVLSSKRTFHALDGRMLDVDVAVEEEAVEVDGFEGGEVVVCVLSAIVVGGKKSIRCRNSQRIGHPKVRTGTHDLLMRFAQADWYYINTVKAQVSVCYMVLEGT